MDSVCKGGKVSPSLAVTKAIIFWKPTKFPVAPLQMRAGEFSSKAMLWWEEL